MAAFLTWITAISSPLLAVNTAADIGGKVSRGVKQGRVHRAERRWQMSPQKAARHLKADLRVSGQAAEVKPALDDAGVWRLLVAGTSAFPESYAGYPVVSKDAAPGAGGVVEVGRGGGRGGGGRGHGGFHGGFRGGRVRYGGGGWWGGWGYPYPLYVRRRRALDDIEGELDDEVQLQRIQRKLSAARGPE